MATKRVLPIPAAPTLAVAALFALAAPGTAQDHLFSFTGYTAGADYGSLTAGEDPGVTLEDSPFYGLQAELWLGRFGARLHTGLADATVEGVSGTGFDILAVDADLLARLRRPRSGLIFQPYGVLGIGVIRYSLGTDSTAVAGYDYDGDPENRAAVVLGLGADFLSGPVGLRMELTNHLGLSSPLARPGGSEFGPVSHVVFSLGLQFRAGYFDPGTPPVNRVRPTRPRPTPVRPPREPEPDTVPADTVETEPADPEPEPDEPVPADTVVVPPPEAPPLDTMNVDTAGPPPVDTTRTPPVDTAGPPVDTLRPPLRPPRPPVDTVGRRPVPVDSGGVRPPGRVPPGLPPRDSVLRPPADTTRPDTTDTEVPPPEAPPLDTMDVDTAGPGTDTSDVSDGNTGGRLFTVRVRWNPQNRGEVEAVSRLVNTLQQAGVPVGSVENPGQGDNPRLRYRRVGALRDAARARVLGNWIRDEYGLAWEWVHIPRDQDVPQEDVDASMAFVERLEQGPGNQGQGQNPGAGPPGGGPPGG